MLGTILKVALLLINSIAVLNEERFLARSKPFHLSKQQKSHSVAVGWLSTPQQPRDNTNSVYQAYDQSGYGANQDVGIKARLIDLISAVRTLMRSTSHVSSSYRQKSSTETTVPLIIINIIVIIYELLLGG